jgi:hypothetical protein
MVQLSAWAVAYLNRLRILTQDFVSITLPLVLVSGEHWRLMFALDLGRSIWIMDGVDLGNTGDIIGCYKVLAALRLLCEWAENTFLDWFSDQVLKQESDESLSARLGAVARESRDEFDCPEICSHNTTLRR